MGLLDAAKSVGSSNGILDVAKSVGSEAISTFTGGSSEKIIDFSSIKDVKDTAGGVLGGVLETAADFDPGPAKGVTRSIAGKVEESPFSAIGALVGLYFGGLHGAQAGSEIGGMLDQAADAETGEVAQNTFYTKSLDYMG